MAKSINHLCLEYSRDLEAYLRDKLPEVPESTAKEVSEYIVNKTGNFMSDWFREQERIDANRAKRFRRRAAAEEDKADEG